MLKKLRLHNFRTYLNAEFSFTPLHLVVGKNNSGKTNLFYAMRFLNATAVKDLAAAINTIPGGSWEVKNWSSKSSVVELSCECMLDFDGTPHTYDYSLILEIEDPQASNQGISTIRVKSEMLRVTSSKFGEVTLLENDGREAHMLHEGKLQRSKSEERITTLSPRDSTMLSKLYELETNRRAIQFRRFLGSWLFFSLDPVAMRFGWNDDKAALTDLQVNAGNLANVMYHIKNIDDRRYRAIIADVCKIEPALEAVSFIPNPGQPATPFVALRSRPQASWPGLSDGTLRYMALAYLAHSATAWGSQENSSPTPVIFIEEPENGLYPGYMRAMFELFEGRGYGSQFIFTSHSPYFINLFDNRREAVTLLRRATDRTEVVDVPEPDDDDEDRLRLAEEYSMEMLD